MIAPGSLSEREVNESVSHPPVRWIGVHIATSNAIAQHAAVALNAVATMAHTAGVRIEAALEAMGVLVEVVVSEVVGVVLGEVVAAAKEIVGRFLAR